MDSNKHKTTSGNTVLSSIVNMCSINICGMSDHSRFVLDKFCYDKSIDILAVQESTTVDVSNLDLKFMTHTSDANNSMNKGAMLTQLGALFLEKVSDTLLDLFILN